MIDLISSKLDQLAAYIRHTFQSMPLIILILLIFSIILVLIFIVFIFLSSQKAAIKAIPPAAIKDDEKKKKDSTEIDENKLPPLGGWISEYLSRKGFVTVSELSLSFLRALEFLKNTLQTYHYKYQLPWYLLIGSEQSGKSTLLEGGEFNFPVGKPDFSEGNPNPENRWNFFNRGIVLDIRGDLLITKDKPQANEKAWRSLLVLLARYRAARPLNGIILTIPATELYGKNKLSLDTLHQRADYLFNKLNAAQAHLGMQLPVYIVITKTDVVPGFKNFCEEIPTKNRTQMLGWSSPYTLSTSYTPKWIDEAFQEIQNQIHRLRLQIFSKKSLSGSNDGLFVFPCELLTLQESLSLYINALFKNNAYQDGLILRGIYFCGDSGMSPLKAIHHEKDHDVEELQYPKTLQEQEERKIFFINELINEKIFHESGIAKPLPRRLINANRGLNIAKATTASFVIMGSYGVFNAYDQFKASQRQLKPVLNNMNQILREINHQKKGSLQPRVHRGEEFDIYARQMIEMMAHMQHNDFFSIFIPASWFSKLHTDLKKSLKVSFQEIIMRTIFNGLALKAQELLYLKPSPEFKSTSLAQLLLPTKSFEFALIKKYVEGLSELNQMIQTYEALKVSGDPEFLKKLIAYTFKGDLPQEFWDHYKEYRKLLNEGQFPKIDLKPYKGLARETLNVLYQNFLNAIFSPNDPGSLPSRLLFFVKSLNQQESKKLPDVALLRELSIQLAQAKPYLGEAGKTWLDGKYFNPDKEWDSLFDKIDESLLFGPDVTQFLVDQTAIGFNNLKLQLISLNNYLTDKKYTLPKSPFSNQETPSDYPSFGLLEIERSLTTLFSENYMSAPSSKPFVTQTPKGKIIYWDDKLVQLAYDLVKRFEEFSTKQIETFPNTLQDNLKLVARRSLQENVMSVLAQAQSFVDLPEVKEGLEAEEVLRSKIASFKDVSPKFIKLLETLTKDNVGVPFVELKSFLRDSGFWLLDQIEKMLSIINPYAVKDFSFKWWDGKQSAASAGFAVRDSEDLKTYLSMQRQQIQKLVDDFARPVVSFLMAEVLNDGKGNKDLLNRWRRIIEAFDDYSKRTPGNSIQGLEDFIAHDLNGFDSKAVLKSILIQDIKESSGDFFLETMRALKKGMRSRAEVLKRNQAIEAYKKIANYFNTHLRGKFPFATSNIKGSEEAQPEHIRELFRYYDEAGASPQEIMDQFYQLGSSSLQVMRFLQQLEDIKQFFYTFLAPDSDVDVPYFEFELDFRANRSREVGADMVVEWVFKPDEDTKITRTDKVKSGRWNYGSPVEIKFRWPDSDSIPVKPQRDPNQPDLVIEDVTASFKYQGRWSLLWLIRNHTASHADYSTISDQKPSLLKFMVPTGGGNKAILFNTMTMTVPSLKPKTPGKVMKVPDFPGMAPHLPEDLLSFTNQPVLTEGMKDPVDFKSKKSDQENTKENKKEAEK